MRKLLLFVCAALLLAQNPKVATLTVSASGSTLFIASGTDAQGTTNFPTRIYHISASWNTSADVYFLYGTGSVCATGATTLLGTYKALTSLALDFPTAPLIVPPGKDFCINFSTTVTAGGGATYDQRP